LLANEKLMFHSCLLEGMDRIVHCAQEGKGRGRIIFRNDRGRRQQACASRHNIALTSPKRLVERQAVIKTGTSRNAVCALNKERALHRD
jgi:hypothetical protein